MFKDSCVTTLTPWLAREEATALPATIFPAYAGSGACVVSLDASGLQGLNHGVQAAFGAAEHAGDLYVVRHNFVGDKVSQNNLLPMGYLEWEMTIDGDRICSRDLAWHAACWKREIHLDTGRVTTEMLLKRQLWLRITAEVPLGMAAPVFEVGLKTYELPGRPRPRPADIRFTVHFHLKTRQGADLFDDRRFEDGRLHCRAAGHEDYRVTVALENSRDLPADYQDSRLSLTWREAVGSEEKTLTWMLRFDGAAGLSELDRLQRDSDRGWRDYYANCGRVEGVDTREAFLYNTSLYLLKAGYLYDNGIPIGVPFTQPWCWFASTFWDSHLVMDAVMKTGNREAAGKFMGYLAKIIQPAGKPFPWMCLYDGQPTVPEERDIAPLVMAAHAMTAVKYDAYFGDDSALAQTVYPICRRVGDFAVKHLFGLQDGQWILTTPVSNDVVDERATEVNQTFTALWFLVILRKTVEYADRLQDASLDRAAYQAILDNPRLEHDDAEYFHSRGVTAAAHPAASWIPFLLYPTEGMPLVDPELMDRTREKYCYADLYLRKQGDYQPWTEFMQASSDFRRGAGAAGRRLIRSGMEHTFGPGYFSEIGPMQETVGLPPHITAHGAFVTAFLEQFVLSSIWEKTIELFTTLPEAYRREIITVENLCCAGRIRLSATRTPGKITARLRGELEGLRLRLPPWPDGRPGTVALWRDGRSRPCHPAAGAHGIEIRLDDAATEAALEWTPLT